MKIKYYLLLVLSITSYSTAALDLDIRSERSDILDFSLLIEHADATLQEDRTDIDFNLDRIGILSFDVPTSGPHFALALGYAFGDVSNADFYDSIGMDGYYLGVGVRYFAFESENLSLQLSGNYLYQSITGSEGAQEASLAWNEFSANAILTFRVTMAMRVYGGPVWGTIDATYRERGENHFTENIDNKYNTGYLAGVSYWVNRLESLGLHYQQAHTEGVVLHFRKLF